MSGISNRFMATAIDDGTTLHGELRSTMPLSQAFANGAAIPSWTSPNSPVIYLTLMEGATLVQPTANSIQWAYNGSVISFSQTETTKSIKIGNTTVNYSGYESTDGKFFKFSFPVPVPNGGGSSISMPALAIISNLASSSNLNVDDIMLTGQYNIGEAPIDFRATINVRITEIASNGFFGQVNFVNGISDITEKNQVITAFGKLYSQDGNEITGCTTKWYLNDDAVGTNGANKTVDGVTYPNAYQVSEAAVTDYATLRCEFYKEGTLVYTAIEGIDDRQDPEYLYVQVNNANGNSASMHKGESVTFLFFVGKSDDPTPDNSKHYNGWSFKVKLYNAQGTEVTTSSIANIPDVVSGYRPLTTENGHYDATAREASLPLSWSVVKEYFSKRISGIVYANHS